MSLAGLLGFVLFGRNPNLSLTITMSASAPSRAQLFFDTGQGFSENQSSWAAVDSRSLAEFRDLTFELPAQTVRGLRFDPLTVPGEFILRDAAIWSGSKQLVRFAPSDIVSLHQIASREQTPGGARFTTVPEGSDSNVSLALHERLRLRRIVFLANLRFFLLCVAPLCLLIYLFPNRLESELQRLTRTVAQALDGIGRRLSSDRFIHFDGGAIAFYAVVLAVFSCSVILDLNGSSIGAYYLDYHRGAPERTWIGEPRASRSDEWGYVTPDILNQTFRADRFAVDTSELGGHSVALTGNIPLWHFTTLFRPQFWGFFLFRADYAFSIYWQSKTLLLLTGVFSWLLIATRSSLWAAAGALWYYFSPFTQWSLSWPSALAEMTGLVCWALVFACYLTVGAKRWALFASALALAACGVNFALCAYPPHMVPLAYLAIFFFTAWCFANWPAIRSRRAVLSRVAAAALAVCTIAITGALVYRELHLAIRSIAETIYPGKRVYHGGATPPLLLASHFLQWTENERHFPQWIGNICEGSGFLWLAPISLLCLRRMALPRASAYLFGALWLTFCLWLAWLVFPIPAGLAALLGLDKAGGARVLPALGLANVGIVAMAATFAAPGRRAGAPPWLRDLFTGLAAAAVLFFLFERVNRESAQFFSNGELVFAALLSGALVSLLAGGRKRWLAAALVASNALVFGAVNPIEQGIGVITSSDLFRFVQGHPPLLRNRWLVFSDSAVMSGFLASTGANVYTGTHYLPDIDHFPLFAASHLNLDFLNRLGYLEAYLRREDEPMQLELSSGVVVRWHVSPEDSILRKLGMRYFAFDQQPPPAATRQLEPLSKGPVDGFWLYRYR